MNNVSGLLIHLIALKVFKNELDILSYETSFYLFPGTSVPVTLCRVLYFIKCLLVD